MQELGEGGLGGGGVMGSGNANKVMTNAIHDILAFNRQLSLLLQANNLTLSALIMIQGDLFSC